MPYQGVSTVSGKIQGMLLPLRQFHATSYRMQGHGVISIDFNHGQSSERTINSRPTGFQKLLFWSSIVFYQHRENIAFEVPCNFSSTAQIFSTMGLSFETLSPPNCLINAHVFVDFDRSLAGAVTAVLLFTWRISVSS